MLALPTENIPWPPDAWSDVYNEYAEHAAWYGGDPNQLASVYSSAVFTPTERGRFWARRVAEERRTMVHVPLAADIAGASADLLFSEPPTIVIPGADEANASSDVRATQARLDQLVQDADVFSKFLEAAEVAAAMGGVFLKPNWDTELAGHPILTLGQVDQAIPDFRWGILRSVVFWRVVLEDDRGVVWRHLERHSRGLIEHALYRGTDDKIGRRVPMATLPETADLPDTVQTGIDDLLVRYVPNMRPNRRRRGSSLGQSDYAASEGLFDSLDEVMSSWIRDIRLGQGRIIVPDMFLERRGSGGFSFDIDREAFVALDMDPQSAKDGGLTLSQFEVRAEEHERTMLALIERIVSAAGYSPQSFGLRIEGRAESGTALRIRERKSLTTRQKKEGYFVRAAEEVLELMLVIDKTIFNGGATPMRPRVEMADSVVPDPKEAADTIEMLHRAQAVSLRTKIRMAHPEWTEVEVENEAQELGSELGIGDMPNPESVLYEAEEE